MTNLTRASNELFRRRPDERFSSLTDLTRHCQQTREASVDRWELPQDLAPSSDLTLMLGEGEFSMTNWSFSQMCRLAGVSRDTLNRVSHKTASRVLGETVPTADKPIQLLTTDDTVRSIHGVSYTRLWNTELLSVVQEFATDFEPPQEGCNGGTGLYCGEQDMFCFLIDPAGWTEIDGEAFAPGFFVWNSEVGRRSVGIQSFWFQAVCQNHIVWDAVEVAELTRKHTANVRDCLAEMRRMIESLVAKRDERRDGFVRVVRNAMRQTLGDDADEALKKLTDHGVGRKLAKQALELAKEQGRFTIYSLVDSITRLNGEVSFAGNRVEVDAKAASLLALAV